MKQANTQRKHNVTTLHHILTCIRSTQLLTFYFVDVLHDLEEKMTISSD